MKRHQIHLAIAAASVLAAACSSTPPRSAAVTPDNAGSAVAIVPQSDGASTGSAMAKANSSTVTAYDKTGSGQPVATKAPAPNILVPATGSGTGSSTANSNVPTGEYTGPGPAGSGTAAANLGRSSESIAGEVRARTMDQRQMSELLGADVRNRQGEKIGDIEEVMLDTEGRPALAIVSTGGFLGIGERRHAVPFASLELANNGTTDRVLDMSREQLRQAPSFNPSERPYSTEPGWLDQNQRSYGRGR